jgi:hypothetical protein
MVLSKKECEESKKSGERGFLEQERMSEVSEFQIFRVSKFQSFKVSVVT